MLYKKWCLMITALAIVSLFTFTSVLAEGPEKAGAKVPKLQSVLTELNDTYDRGVLTATQQLIDSRGLIVKDNKVRVMLDLMPGMTPNEAVLHRYGVEVEKRHDTFWRVLVPVGALRDLAGDLEGVRFIRKPMKPHPETGLDTSEGVAHTNANAWHSAGYTGSGVDVAVIDGGFGWLCWAEGTGDVPSNTKVTFGVPSFYDAGCESGDWHGTNVTDILIDMAPDVDLYLIRIGDESDLEDAKDYCITNGIDIINMSLGFYNLGGYNGIGPLCDIVNDAHAHDILFVKSAGNNQNYHYMDMFNDSDGNGWHNFSGADEENLLYNNDGSTSNLTAGWGMDIYLFWGWPTTTVDYDLYLYRVGSGTPVATSTTAQTGAQPGVESIEVTLPFNGQYYIKIQRADGTGNAQLKFYTVGYQPEYRHSESSFSQPADAVGCFAVGSRHQSGWAAATTVDDYSSFGPTLDGRIKPDIVGPSCVDVSISSQCFGGTSAAAPHVAGAAALVMEACPAMDVDDVRAFLEGRAIDVAPAGKDNEWGWGKLDMGSPTDPCPTEESIEVTSPNGGECWEHGSVHNITWTSSGTSGLVDIRFSSNNGGSWSLLFNDIADDGSEPWTIPPVVSTDCLIRICDADATPCDDGDGTFTIDETCEFVCYPDLPAPQLIVDCKEDYLYNGQEMTRYYLDVLNWMAYPDELFTPAPDLPPCGSNTNASRTWAEIFAEDGTRIFGFCAQDNAADLNTMWFAVERGTEPANVYIEIWDRRCDITYPSNLASTDVPYCEECEQPILSLCGYKEVSWADPFWTVQVEIHNAGPGTAKNVTAAMNSDIAWLVIPDPNCAYGDIAQSASSWGLDSYTFDLSAHPGGSFNVWFDVTYEDDCGNQYSLRLDPEFDRRSGEETPALTYKLGQNYPNPFNPNTTISFQIPAAGYLSLNIYDASGKLVRTLVDGHWSEGLHAVNWNGLDNNGAAVASGIYFYKIDAGAFVETKKMVLLR
ncbi:MAG: S8 family serine peptidase [bacterium]|nr:MAG: S8 family serine peptidase [bacterium]